jgi:hypothetical protein
MKKAKAPKASAPNVFDFLPTAPPQVLDTTPAWVKARAAAIKISQALADVRNNTED